MKILSLGYDLGDGETIVDGVIFEPGKYTGTNKKLYDKEFYLRMPGSSKDGDAIPTGFGYDESGKIVLIPSITSDPDEIRDIHAYFKRQPTGMLNLSDKKSYNKLDEKRYNELKNLFKSGKYPEYSATYGELYSEEFTAFRDSVRIFTDSIFSNEQFKEAINFHASECDKIIFCVGHPTKWNKLDCLIYKAILNESILGKGEYVGKKSSMILAAESRAAYLYLREEKKGKPLEKNTCALLVDVGSSTIDVTAVVNDSRSSQHNSGNNYLGVRSIDYLIKEWFVKQLKFNKYFPNAKEIYQNIISQNPSQNTALILICRKAKEDAYSSRAGNIFFTTFPPKKLRSKTIDELAQNSPVASALSSIAKIPDSEVNELKNQTWTELFKNFLETQKAEIKNLNLQIGRVIMTGSAIRMEFIPKIIKQVFSDIPAEEIWTDSNPSHSISKGLALVGPADEKSKYFQARMDRFTKEDIPQIIKDNLSSLADTISPVVESIVTDIILDRVDSWRRDSIRTIDDMIYEIKGDLTEKKLAEKLKDSDRYKNAVKNWTVDTLGDNIALKLKSICEDYNVPNFSRESLNVMKSVTVNPGTGTIEVNILGDGLRDAIDPKMQK